MCVFEGILAYLVSGPKSTPDFPGLSRISLDFPGRLLVFVEIMPDKVILDHKQSYLVSFENLNFFQFLAKMQTYTDTKRFKFGFEF